MDLREEMDSGQIFLAKTSFKITAKGNCRLKRTASLFNSHGHKRTILDKWWKSRAYRQAGNDRRDATALW